MFYTYVLRCGDGNLYIGSTADALAEADHFG